MADDLPIMPTLRPAAYSSTPAVQEGLFPTLSVTAVGTDLPVAMVSNPRVKNPI